MLILTRWLDETIVINGVTKIKIVGVRGKQIKIGIDAPQDVPIIRQELLNQPHEETDGSKNKL